MGVIYKLTFPSGKCYVGQTAGSAVKRWTRHRWEAEKNGSQAIVHHAIRKYGWKTVKPQVIATVADNELDEEEKRQIEIHNCITPNGYNGRVGGLLGSLCAEEVRKKMRDSYTDDRRTKLRKDRQEYIAQHRKAISDASAKAWSSRTEAERQIHRDRTSQGRRAKDRARTTEELAASKEKYANAARVRMANRTPDQIEKTNKNAWSDDAKAKRLKAMLKRREEKLSKMSPNQREKQQALWDRKERERTKRTGSTLRAQTGSSASSCLTTSTCTWPDSDEDATIISS